MDASPHEPRSEREARLDKILADFLSLRDAGLNPDPRLWVRDHPDLAADLEGYFRDERLIEEIKAIPAPTSLRPGSTFGGYEIIGEVSRRDSGDVYRARRISDGRPVALKVFATYPLSNQADRARFRREVEALRELDHRHIVPLLEAGEADGLPFLAMPFIEGTTLSGVFRDLTADPPDPAASHPVSFPGRRDQPEHLTATAPQTRARAVAMVGVQVAGALAQAHAKGILHRDVKPGNLMLDAHGHVFLTDFDLALTEGLPDLTRRGEVVGTYRYMSPERFRGWSDPRSNIYALGLTLYELIILRRAIPEPDRHHSLETMSNRGPKPPRSIDRSIPRDLETIIRVAIQPEPADRYKSAGELAEDLLRCLEGRPILARLPSPSRRILNWSRRHKFEAASILIFVGLLSGLFRYAYLHWVEAEYQTRLFSIQKIRSTEHTEGWSQAAWTEVEKAARFPRDDRLRDEAAATLAGVHASVDEILLGIGGRIRSLS